MFNSLSKINIYPRCMKLLLGKQLATAPTSNFQISDEISKCIEVDGPIVALESTIITHGMPYPDNLRTALEVEEVVRNHNAVPATIGIINGKTYIGMNKQELKILALNKNSVKISRRDLPYVLSKGFTGGTTVSGTMTLAHKVGISIFVTGGIGGVHRFGETSMDVSADLMELSRTPMTVISAGIKSILDIGRTLEFLETQGVCVTTFGQSKEFPAFFTPKSGYFAPWSVDTISEAAELIVCRDALQLQSGVLIAVPIPENQASDGELTEKAISQALKDAQHHNIRGKDVTPFLLKRVNELSGGASLRANIALIKNNAKIGSLIAVELARIQGNFKKPINSQNKLCTKHHGQQSPRGKELLLHQDKPVHCERPVIIGGSILDMTTTVLQEKIQLNGSTHVGRVRMSAGGVGRNMADCLNKLGLNPFLISAIGDDSNGATLLRHTSDLDTNGIRRLPCTATAVYAVILDKNGECLFGIGDMHVHNRITEEQVKSHKEILLEAPLVAMDGNMPLSTMDYILDLCEVNDIPVWFEPTDFNKAAKPFACKSWSAISYASPNVNELRTMNSAICGASVEPVNEKKKGEQELSSILEECIRLGLPLLKHILTLVVTLGPNGVLLMTTLPGDLPFCIRGRRGRISENNPVRAIHYYPPEPKSIVSVSGAGDCFAAAMMGAIVKGFNQESCIRAGQQAARISLTSHHAVPDSVEKQSVFLCNVSFPEPQMITV